MGTPELSLAQQVAAAREFGFSGIDFRMKRNGQGEIPEVLTAAEAETIRKTVGELVLPGLLCYNESLAAGETAMEESILRCLQLAKQLACPLIRIFTGKIDEEKTLERLSAVLKRVLERDKSPVKIGIQNHSGTSLNLSQALWVCEAVKSDRLGVILSPDHCYMTGEDVWELLPALAKYVFELYVADVDDENRLVLIGEGRIPFGRILGRLRQYGFNGYVTLKWEKCWHPELPSYPEAFRSFLSWIGKTDTDTQ